MASFVTSGNAIVNYLNANKSKYGDVGQFEVSTELNVGAEAEAEAEASVFTKLIQTNKYNAITQVIKETLNIENEQIKLIILEIKGKDTLVLDCDAFLIDADKMSGESYIESLNHVIIGKTDDAYAVIGYVEVVKVTTRNPRGASSSSLPCTIFKLKNTNDACAVLPVIIKETIYKCITEYYKSIPKNISNYYIPPDKAYTQTVVAERAADARAAEEEAATEVKGEDKCDFKALLKSKIKNESNEYCKVTDPGLLERIQQNIDGNKVDVNVSGLNDLINTRLDGLKKVKEEEEKYEDEEKERNDGKTISENKEAQMIREANEMFMISQQVLSKGAAYNSSEFFKEYLTTNAMVNEQEEKEAEPVMPVIETPVAAPQVTAPVVALAEAPVAETRQTEETALGTDVPGPKEVTQQPKQLFREAAKKVIKSRAKQPNINAFTYAPIQEQNRPA